jgi:hypothetical protein
VDDHRRELQVEAFPPLYSLEPNTIDNLAQPIACNLVVMIGGSFRMEVRKGLVYPHRTQLDDVQIDASAYSVIKVDMVHDNAKNMKLKVPPNDTTLTIRDAINRGFSRGLILMLTHQQLLQRRPLLVSQTPLLVRYFLRHNLTKCSRVHLQFECSHVYLHLRLRVPRSLHLIRCSPLLLYQRR